MKSLFLLLSTILVANAHFLTLLPQSDNIATSKKDMIIDIMFIHPFEQTGMQLVKPEGFYVNTKEQQLNLNPIKKFDHQAWRADVQFNRPGIYQFFTVPKPYFEPAEQKYIKHVPKVIISAFGLEDGWDKAIGLKYEIIPMVKPFALYAGNQFQGMVLKNGKPVSNVEVEVELYNEFGLKAPTDAHITQVVKTNSKGEFSFTMNHKGWWGFAALIEEGEKEYNGKMYPIEHGALIWVKAY